MSHVLKIGVTAAIAALVLSATATADKEKIRYTAAGQTDARAAVIKKTDLGTTVTWTGGPTEPDLSNTQFAACAYKPRESDLTTIGAAEADWKTAGLELDSETTVLQTPTMVARDWQRTVTAPQVLPCLRASLQKVVKPSEHILSLHSVSFPRLTQYTRKFRLIMSVKAGTGKTTKLMFDFIAIGQGQTELSLTTISPYVTRAAVNTAEIRLSENLISRIRA
ncbi:MAG TPA: hypothetical protein VH063_12380 [Gaiellaceae bacterium]|jgi:hypothetical protein|nr:hypothetical protein [Gaiellaceae bacterium]